MHRLAGIALLVGQEGTMAGNGRYAQPSSELRFCIICGAGLGWLRDKAGRPYVSCGNCQCRIFPHTALGVSGIEILHELVMRTGRPAFVQAVQRRAMRKMIVAPYAKPKNKTLGRR